MDDRALGRGVAFGRVAFGLASLLAPKVVFRSVAGDASPGMVLMLRIFGIRDVVLGAGALRSLAGESTDTSWVAMGALADTADAVVATTFRKEIGTAATAATLGLAIPASLAGWKCVIGLRRS
jgi:hypothetical protein